MVRVTKLELHRTISDIMKKGDLDQLTTKKIRIICEQKYNVDLSSRKEEIDLIVMAFVNKHCEKKNTTKSSENNSEDESDSEKSNEDSASSSEESASESCSDSECSDSSNKDEPKKSVNQVKPSPKPASVPKKLAVKRSNSEAKKVAPQPVHAVKKSNNGAKKVAPQPALAVKRSNNEAKKVAPQPIKRTSTASAGAKRSKKAKLPEKQAEMDDAEYARQLQAEEFNFRQRTVRTLFRNIPKKSDNNEPSKKRKATAFQKKCLLSPALAEVLGTDEMSRPDVVQKMWSIVRERNLFDLSNKQYALCDEQLKGIFGKKRIRLIGMMKYLKKHIKDIR